MGVSSRPVHLRGGGIKRDQYGVSQRTSTRWINSCSTLLSPTALHLIESSVVGARMHRPVECVVAQARYVDHASGCIHVGCATKRAWGPEYRMYSACEHVQGSGTAWLLRLCTACTAWQT